MLTFVLSIVVGLGVSAFVFGVLSARRAPPASKSRDTDLL